MTPFTKAAMLCLAAATLAGQLAAAPFVPVRNAQCVAYSRDGEFVAIGYSGPSDGQFPPGPHPNPAKCSVIEWFRVDGARLKRVETFGDLTKVAFSSRSRWVGACRLYMTSDRVPLNTVFVWQTDGGSEVQTLNGCQAFEFWPDQDRILVASRTKCVEYALPGGEKGKQYPPFAGAISLDVAPAGDRIAAIVATADGHALRMIAVESGDLLAESPTFSQPFYAAQFSPNGQQIVTGHEGRVILWDGTSLQPLRQFESRQRGLQHPFHSPRGDVLGMGNQTNGDVEFRELATGRRLAAYTFEQGAFHTYHRPRDSGTAAPERSPHQFTFRPDGRAFLSGPHGGIVRLLDSGQDVQRFGR